MNGAPNLGGTGRLADDLYLLAHHDATGKPLVQPRAKGLGLAGGMLAELVLPGSLYLVRGGLTVADRRPPPDPLARYVLGLILGEREHHPVRDWLRYFARTAAEDVAYRLAGSGYLARAAGRGLWGRCGRWVPVDADSAFAPLLRVLPALDAARPVPAYGGVLAGLATACGLGFHLAQYAPVPGSAHTRRGRHPACTQLAGAGRADPVRGG
jgi:hypothetical protein